MTHFKYFTVVTADPAAVEPYLYREFYPHAVVGHPMADGRVWDRHGYVVRIQTDTARSGSDSQVRAQAERLDSGLHFTEWDNGAVVLYDTAAEALAHVADVIGVSEAQIGLA